MRGERDALRAQCSALLQERDELHAVLVAALEPDASDAAAQTVDPPFIVERMAPMQAQLVRMRTERDLACADADSLRSQLLACTTLLRECQMPA